MSNLDPDERRRPRADAQRNRSAVLDGAILALSRRPDASMEDIAAAAGVTRQTVYAHYASREALLAAVVDRISAEATAALESASVGTGPAVDALRRWLDASWSMIERYPVLLTPAVAELPAADDHDGHAPVMVSLAELIRRGRRTGEFDDRLPVDWLVAAIFSLGHTASREVGEGRMTTAEAGAGYRESALRLCLRQAPDAPR